MSLTLDELLAEVASAPTVTPADQDPRLGTMVGPYKVQERLGRGGMGTVYLARDTRLERDVALKMLHDESAVACGELLREARRAATVSHASIAQVFDVSEEAPPYIAMELVEGDSLHERLTKDPPGPEESLRILGDTADAIAALHAQGIVHRDLTPRNIALTADGHLKILDFGIAMPLGNRDPQKGPESILYAGTERYVAPERADGRAPSAKEDVFSIGVLASDLFAHAPPPQAVVEILARCRSADESKRPSDLRVVAKQLRAVHDAPKPRSATPLIAAASLLAMALAAYLAFSDPAAQPDESVYEMPPEESAADVLGPGNVQVTRLTFYAEDHAIQELSGSDHTFLVTDIRGVSRFDRENESERFALPPSFRATSAHDTSSGVLVLGTTEGERDAFYYSDGEASHIPIDSYIDGISVAHDGRRVAILESDVLRIGTLDDTHQALLRPESAIQLQVEMSVPDQTVSWSPDDERLLVLTFQNARAQLRELDVTAGKRRTVFESPTLLGRLGTYAFTYVDNDTIAFTMREPDDASVGIYTLSLSIGGPPHLVGHVPTAIQSLHWCPSRGTFRFVAYDADYKIYYRLLTDDEPRRMTFSDHQDWVTGFAMNGEDIHFSRMSVTGSRAFSVPRSSPSSEIPLAVDAVEPLPRPTRALQHRHDTWLAFVPREEGRHELLHITPEMTQSLAELQATPGRWRAPPFGVQLRRSQQRIFVGRGQNERLQISELHGRELRERFTVEGAFINWFVFAVAHDGRRFIYRDLDGLLLTDEEGALIRRIQLHGFDGLQSADFLRDGSLIVTAGDSRQFSLLHVNAETNETELLASSYHRWFGGVATSPTDDAFAYTTVGWDTDVFELTP